MIGLDRTSARLVIVSPALCRLGRENRRSGLEVRMVVQERAGGAWEY